MVEFLSELPFQYGAMLTGRMVKCPSCGGPMLEANDPLAGIFCETCSPDTGEVFE